MPKSRNEQGRFAYEGLDRVIHEKARSRCSPRWSPIPRGWCSAT